MSAHNPNLWRPNVWRKIDGFDIATAEVTDDPDNTECLLVNGQRFYQKEWAWITSVAAEARLSVLAIILPLVLGLLLVLVLRILI